MPESSKPKRKRRKKKKVEAPKQEAPQPQPQEPAQPKQDDNVIQYRRSVLLDEVHSSPARFRVLDCGRRFGKSVFGIIEGLMMSRDLYEAGKTQPRQRGVIVAPTVPMLRENWRMAKDLLRSLIQQSHEAEMWLDLGPLGDIDFKSSESQYGVGRGAGYNWAVIDEASRVPRQAWEEDLRPALADRNGKALFLSTPFGRNWFFEMWNKGREEGGDTQSWKYSTIDGWRARFKNNADRLAEAEKEWKAIVETTSERTLQQEYLADFLVDGGQIWSLTKCFRGKLRPPIPGRRYSAGLDVAKAEDWMVTAIVEVESRQLVALFRSRHRNWDLQKRSAIELIRQYPRCHTIIDSTGVGDPIAHDLRREGLDIEDMVFTSRRKEEMVENLAIALDHGYLGIPQGNDTEWLIDELLSYTETKLPSGRVRYSAPEGKHDDGVTALMLAVWGIRFDLLQPEFKPKDEQKDTLRYWLDYQRKVNQWRAVCPDMKVPQHPNSIRWQSRRFNRGRRLIHA